MVAIDGSYDLVGDVLHTFVFGFENLCGNFLVTTNDVAGNACGDESTVFG